jgi:hypothetical protein
MRPRFPALLALLVLTAACATRGSQPGDLPAQEYSGHLIRMAEGSWFEPCTGAPAGERWWVVFTERSVPQIQAAALDGRMRPGERTFVHWRAAPTDESVAGPGGPAVLVREILELRPAADGDCPTR